MRNIDIEWRVYHPEGRPNILIESATYQPEHDVIYSVTTTVTECLADAMPNTLDARYTFARRDGSITSNSDRMPFTYAQMLATSRLLDMVMHIFHPHRMSLEMLRHRYSRHRSNISLGTLMLMVAQIMVNSPEEILQSLTARHDPQ